MWYKKISMPKQTPNKRNRKKRCFMWSSTARRQCVSLHLPTYMCSKPIPPLLNKHDASINTQDAKVCSCVGRELRLRAALSVQHFLCRCLAGLSRLLPWTSTLGYLVCSSSNTPIRFHMTSCTNISALIKIKEIRFIYPDFFLTTENRSAANNLRLLKYLL